MPTGTKNLIKYLKLGDTLERSIFQSDRIPRAFLPISAAVSYRECFFFLKGDRVYFVGRCRNKNNYKLLTQSVFHKVKQLLGNSRGMYIITTSDKLPTVGLPRDITHNFINL